MALRTVGRGKCCWRRIDGWWCVVGIGGGGGVTEAVGESDGVEGGVTCLR